MNDPKAIERLIGSVLTLHWVFDMDAPSIAERCGQDVTYIELIVNTADSLEELPVSS